MFVVFRHRAEKSDPVVALTVDRRPLLSLSEALPPIVVRKAVYGVLEDPPRTRDVRAKVQELIDRGDLSFKVGRLAAGDDPAFGTLKRVVVEYTIADKSFTASGIDTDTIAIAPPGTPPPLVELHRGAGNRLILEAQQAGRFELKTASGRTRQVRVSALPPPLPISGPWQVSFPPHLGAPQKISLAKLISWSEHPETGVKYFSGTATYTKKIRIPAKMLAKNRRLYLDLGAVAVMARVQLNGKDLGVLWKPSFTLDVTAAARPGENTLEVKVTNLWINRMLGDEQLPEDSERNSDGTLKSWPPWVQAGQPSPTGRITFTSWRLWKKGEHLQPSGLLGPVTLRAAERMNIQE